MLTRDLFAVADLVVYLLRPAALLQDIIRDDEIKLDWFFKASLMHDIVNVRTCLQQHSVGDL